MTVPDWYEVALLSLAAFRVTRLIGEDVVLDPIRSRLLRIRGWHEGEPVPSSFRRSTAEFLTCYWCLGFHASWVLWLCWVWEPTATLVVCVPLAVSAAVGLLGSTQ